MLWNYGLLSIVIRVHCAELVLVYWWVYGGMFPENKLLSYKRTKLTKLKIFLSRCELGIVWAKIKTKMYDILILALCAALCTFLAHLVQKIYSSRLQFVKKMLSCIFVCSTDVHTEINIKFHIILSSEWLQISE